MRWCSGKSARFAVGKPRVYSSCRVIPKDFKKIIFTAFLPGARHFEGGCGEQAGKFACCFLGQGTKRDATAFMWQTGGGARSLSVPTAQCHKRLHIEPHQLIRKKKVTVLLKSCLLVLPSRSTTNRKCFKDYKYSRICSFLPRDVIRWERQWLISILVDGNALKRSNRSKLS